jgi:ABC-2 type transport system ATP-binding protein
MDNAIALKGVTKTFGRTKAVQNLDLTVPNGALWGFIGPNGAGKTTSIRMMMSILFPDSGEIAILGRPSAIEAKDRIGYLPEERGVYRRMRVGAFLIYIARLKGVHDVDLAKRVRESLERVGMEDAERKRCAELSKGMLQKVQFLAAIIHQPDLLILDEPFSGLDPVSARQMRELVMAEHRRGATVLFSTHVMSHAEELCEHVLMMHQGRKVLDEQIATIRRRYDTRRILFDAMDPHADMSPIVAMPEVVRIERADTGYEFLLAEGTDCASAIRRITLAVAPARIELSRPRLEDIFIQIVSRGSHAATQAHEALTDLPDAVSKASTA